MIDYAVKKSNKAAYANKHESNLKDFDSLMI